jgi:hypothetical protein
MQMPRIETHSTWLDTHSNMPGRSRITLCARHVSLQANMCQDIIIWRGRSTCASLGLWEGCLQLSWNRLLTNWCLAQFLRFPGMTCSWLDGSVMGCQTEVIRRHQSTTVLNSRLWGIQYKRSHKIASYKQFYST